MGRSRVAVLTVTLVLAAAAGAPAAQFKYDVLPQNDSGETGTITLTPTPDNKGTIVSVVTKGQGAAAQPLEVRKGTCAHLDSKPAFPLQTLQNGRSRTTLSAVPVTQLTSGAYAVSVQKSAADPETYVACAELSAVK